MQKILSLARFAARVFLIDTVQMPASADELISRLLYLDRRANFHL